MPLVQATLSFVVELRDFHNIDLYHRGYYQVRTHLKTCGQPSINTGSNNGKLTAFVEPPFRWEQASTRIKVPEAVKASYVEQSVSLPAYVPDKACSKTLLIMYREETARLCDVFEQRILIQVDPINLEESLMKNDLFLCVELWFVEDPLERQVESFYLDKYIHTLPFSTEFLTKVCERQLRIHITPSRGLHYHFTVFFDYFHLCAIELALYGALTNITSSIISWPKLSPHNTPVQTSNQIITFAQQTWHSIICSIKQPGRHHFALAIHRHLCQVLLAASESMLLFWRESIPYLPLNVRPRIEPVDFRSKLDALVQTTQTLETDDDLANQISFDIARLSSQNTVLFKQLCRSVTLQSKLAAFLRRRFHQIRMKRFAEAFFCQELSLVNLLAIYDSSVVGHESLANDVRQSNYFQKLPTLPVTCREIDGDITNLPIIFEDIFLPLNGNESEVKSLNLSLSLDGICTTNVINKKLEHLTNNTSMELLSIHKSLSSTDSDVVCTPMKSRSDNDNESGIYMEEDAGVVVSLSLSKSNRKKSVDLSRCDILLDNKKECTSISNYVRPSTPAIPLNNQHQNISRSSPNLLSPSIRQFHVTPRPIYKPPLEVSITTMRQLSNGESKRKLYLPVNHSRKFHYFDKSRGTTVLSHLNSNKSKVKLVGYRSIKPSDDNMDQCFTLTDNRSRLTESSINIYSDASHSSHSSIGFRPTTSGLAIRDIRSRSLHNLSLKSPQTRCTHLETINATNNSSKSTSLSLMNISSAPYDTSLFQRSINKENIFFNSNSFISPTNCANLKLSNPTCSKSNVLRKDSFPRHSHEVVALGTLKIPPVKPPGGCVPLESISNETDSLLPCNHLYKADIGSSSVSLPNIPLSCTIPRVVSEGCLTNISSMDQFTWSKSRRRVKVRNLKRNHILAARKSQSSQLKTYTADLAYLGSCSDLQLAVLDREFKALNYPTFSTNNSFTTTSNASFSNCLFESKKRLTKSIDEITTGDACDNQRFSNNSDPSHPSSQVDNNNYFSSFTNSRFDNQLKEYGYQISDLLSSDEELPNKTSPKLTILEMLNTDFGRNGSESLPRPKAANYDVSRNREFSFHQLANHKHIRKANSLSYTSSVPHKRQNGYRNTLNDSHHSNSKEDQSLVNILSPGVMEFLRLKEQVKRQIAPHFQGHVYSDFATLAAPYAYFSEAPVFNPDVHLVVCVHGLDGNAGDLRLVRVYLQMALPDCNLQFLMSECNQDDTFGGFNMMSEKLVSEIVNYIDEMDEKPKRISFVGHSMGCVIIRAALLNSRMEPYLSKLHTFLSLSGPHLGTVYNSSGLINMGIWVMQKIKKSESLSQLRMRDDQDLRNTYLYRLSTSPGLDLFRYVLLVGSPQDRYVPYHSTRIELCKAAIKDSSTLGIIYIEMVTNLLQRLIKSARTTVVRYDVHYNLSNSANTLIGRAAHIAVLDSEIFLEKFICVSGAKYFR
ncbi:Protein FAM135A [Schistosoma japonicum]|nr:Protein FAM135A [Schistosoma japonicum]KAH8863134.1 Protein FAM135A [Schistosoma japonicum]KAH8863135.1 Protein FAM135A [Schistosoma japonicum]KAH8863136.1 Protein FAM135A [Schistosoma japonicum]